MSAPHQNGSFSYKAINPVIKNILDNRSILNNTIQVAQPFIKVTSTLRLKEVLGEGNYGFTLGTHAIPEDVKYEDIYSDRQGNGLIGYTYTPSGRTRRVYAKINQATEVANRFFDGEKTLAKTSDFAFIPPPGITSVNIGRNRNGLIQSAKVTFSVPTQGQLEMLNRTLLIPGMGIVVEWGQQFSENQASIFGQRGIWEKTTRDNMFPWYDRNKLTTMLSRLGNNEVGIEEIMKDYIIPTQGQYSWMFGRVANFSTKSNSDGSFECSMTVVGPAENAWAYNVINTVVPTRNDNSICSETVQSIYSYFSDTSAGANNLKSLLETTKNSRAGDELFPWKDHVQYFTKPNPVDGEKSSEPKASEDRFGDAEDAYFMTWRFFVNVVLNNKKYGVKRVLMDARLTDPEADKVSLLRPYSEDGVDFNITKPYINDPYENFIGNNKYLRSVDPSTLIIVNETAVSLARQDLTTNRPNIANELTTNTQLSDDFARQGDYLWSAARLPEVAAQRFPDKGFLSTGVWINHKSVVQSMISADTILAGVSNLLQRMSSATMGYWQLAIDVSEPLPEPAYPATTNYTVVDINFKDSSDYAVTNFIENVHIFNKYIRNSGSDLVGSDVTECSVDLNLPKRLFSQIATLGLVQTSDVNPDETKAPILNGANETLRKMFAITSVSEFDTDGLGPDITLPASKREVNDVCKGTSTQTTAQTAGTGRTTGQFSSDDLARDSEDIQARITSLENELKEKCSGVCADQVASISATTINNTTSITRDSVSYTNVNLAQTEVTINKNFRGRGNAARLYDKNYRNGRIPSKYLRTVNGVTLYKDASDAFELMRQAAQNDGITLTVNDSYRNIQRQSSILSEKGYYSGLAPFGTPPGTARYDKGLATTPGTSNHGWGLAVDIANTRDNSPTYRWLQQNAGRFGFEKTIRDEPWHWEYVRFIAENTINPVTENPEEVDIVIPNVPPNVIPNTTPECQECVRIKLLLNQERLLQQKSSRYDTARQRLVREFPQYNSVFKYVEMLGDLMVSNIANDADGSKSNAFGASPGTLSIDANITLPGIAGLRIGELFWVDRIPAFYKAFGAFQILSIEDTISTDGWQTRINAKFNYLGERWKTVMAKKLNEVLPSINIQREQDR